MRRRGTKYTPKPNDHHSPIEEGYERPPENPWLFQLRTLFDCRSSRKIGRLKTFFLDAGKCRLKFSIILNPLLFISPKHECKITLLKCFAICRLALHMPVLFWRQFWNGEEQFIWLERHESTNGGKWSPVLEIPSSISKSKCCSMKSTGGIARSDDDGPKWPRQMK